MMKRALLLMLTLAGIARAQSLPNLPRATVGGTGGLNDSALVLVSDSAHRTRATTIGVLKTVFTGGGGGGATVSDTVKLVTFDSARTKRLRADTVTSQGGASKRLVLQTTTSGSALTTAIRFNEVQQALHTDGSAARPGISFAGDSTMGIYRNSTNVNVGISGTAVLGISPTRITALGVPLSVNAVGSVSSPMFGMNSPNTGLFFSASADTIKTTINGVQGLSLGVASLSGGAANMNIQAGTGNSRQLTLQTTSSTGVARSNMTLTGGGDSSVVFLGPVKWASGGNNGRQIQAAIGSASVPSYTFAADTTTGIYRAGAGQLNFTVSSTSAMTMAADTTYMLRNVKFSSASATAAGDVQACIKTTGASDLLTKGATCGTSSAKVKTNFASIFDPVAKTMALQPTRYSYIPGMYGGRTEYGLVADSAMVVDPTLVFTADHDEVLPNGLTLKKGDALNVNDRAVLSLLIATVQQQQRQIDSLRVRVGKKEKP